MTAIEEPSQLGNGAAGITGRRTFLAAMVGAGALGLASCVSDPRNSATLSLTSSLPTTVNPKTELAISIVTTELQLQASGQLSKLPFKVSSWPNLLPDGQVLIGRLGGGRGHRTFTGTPEQVADTIEYWGAHGAADGFNVMPAVLPSGFELFAEHVVPLLQRRGLFRAEYEGTTLREHYGLPRPASRYAAARQPA